MTKKVYVDQDTCIGCTLCTQMCPEVFGMDENGKAKAANPGGADETGIETAINACPVHCIKWEE